MDKTHDTSKTPTAQLLHNSRWRVRACSHKENIAGLLKQRGEQGLGIRSSELYSRPDLYGRSPRNRVSELCNQHNWKIGSKPYGDSDWFYWLRSDNTGKEYPTHRFNEPTPCPRPQLPEVESDFMRRRREEEAVAAPLFAGVRQ